MTETKQPQAVAVKQPSWTKRHQVAIAIVGAALSTASYFGKDHALEHWKTLIANIKAGEADDDVAQTSTRLDIRLERMSNDIHTLADDALALETGQKPHAEADSLNSTRAESAASRNAEINLLLTKSNRRLASLSQLIEVADPSNPYKDQLKALRQEVDKQLLDTHKAELRGLASNIAVLGYQIAKHSKAVGDVDNEAIESRQNKAEDIENRTEKLAFFIRDHAEQMQTRYKADEDRTTYLLSGVFIIGLFLSLVGKLSGGDGELSLGE